jgi:hypothetical protein
MPVSVSALMEHNISVEVDGWSELAEYAVRFLAACHGPLYAKWAAK